MTENAAAEEQLRRLKNTVMGAGYRLSQMAQSGELHASASAELASISGDLDETVARLERLLATLRRND